MLLLWLGGPCPCQLFDIHLDFKKTFNNSDTYVRRAKQESWVGFMIQYACASGWQREWLKGSNEFNCHNRITQINRGQATHLDYMCTCAVSESLTGAIVLAGGCAKSITQTDPWCWTSWKSWLVSGIHVPAQLSSCHLAARWAGWGSVALSLLRAYLQITLIWNTVQRRGETMGTLSLGDSFPQSNEMLCTVTQVALILHNRTRVTKLFASPMEVNCLTSHWRQSVTWWAWWSWCVRVWA